MDKLRALIPPQYREWAYRVVSAASMTLLGIGTSQQDKALLWAQTVVSGLAAVLALLYATSAARLALYAVVGPLGSLLMAYGLVTNAHWAVIAAAAAQVFGVTTAAAKTVQLQPHAYVIFGKRS